MSYYVEFQCASLNMIYCAMHVLKESKHSSFKLKNNISTTRPLELLRMDLCGLMIVEFAWIIYVFGSHFRGLICLIIQFIPFYYAWFCLFWAFLQISCLQA